MVALRVNGNLDWVIVAIRDGKNALRRAMVVIQRQPIVERVAAQVAERGLLHSLKLRLSLYAEHLRANV